MFRRFQLWLVAGIIEELSHIRRQLNEISMKQSEQNAKILELAPKLVRAVEEIKVLIATLKQTDPDVSPEGAEAIAKMETALGVADDLAPEIPPAPPEE